MFSRLVLLVPALVCFDVVAHEEDESSEIEEVRVEGRRQDLVGEARTASEGLVGFADLKNRPLLRPGDVLESIPNLVMTQHSGSGKSNQMFLRGFNLDHGTDFATWVDGMPVNMRSHGHGQGYTDINFIIPELIGSIEYRKGPYYAELGDFSSAGGAHIRHIDTLPDPVLKLGVGANNYRRALAAAGFQLAEVHGMGALEVQGYDGPWTDIEEDLKKVNGLIRIHGTGDSISRRLDLMFYDASWNSADQIPSRAVEAGVIDSLGSIDTTTGGETRRASLSGELDWTTSSSEQTLKAYAIDYRLNLWSNFTYFLDRPVLGDQIEQFDNRTVIGGNWTGLWRGQGRTEHLHHRVGVEVRHDDIDVGLYNARERQRFDTVRDDRIRQTSVAAFYELEFRFAQRWRTVLGVRADHYWFDVASREDSGRSGSRTAGLISPKANLAYSVDDATEAYLSAGYAFHSNDARGVIEPSAGGGPSAAADPLVRSRGAEVGFRTQWLPGLTTTVAAWWLKLDSEIVFVGDAGTTEPSGASRRTGLELNNAWQLNERWAVEADLAWTRARFIDALPGQDRVPGSIEWVVSMAANLELDNGVYAQLRYRFFDGVPLTEAGDVTAGSSSMVNLSLGWGNERWRVQLDALNLLDSSDSDVAYFYASRLPGEPAAGIEDIHSHRFEPRQFRLSVQFVL